MRCGSWSLGHCCCSVTQLCLSQQPTAALQASLSFTIPQSFLTLMSTESVMPSNHLILCRSLLLTSVLSSISQPFASGGQSIGASASPSVSPMNVQDWLPSGWTGWISLQSKGLSRIFSKLQLRSIDSSALSLPYGATLTSVHNCWENYSFGFVSKVMSLLFNMLSRFVIAFLPRSKCLLISWLQSPSTVILEPKKIKTVIICNFPPYVCHEVVGQDA